MAIAALLLSGILLYSSGNGYALVLEGKSPPASNKYVESPTIEEDLPPVEKVRETAARQIDEGKVDDTTASPMGRGIGSRLADGLVP